MYNQITMTNEQINIAIAEVLGWKRPDDPDVMKFKQGWSMPEKWWMCPKGVLRFKHDIPNYCNDLNAMNEAEKVLTPKQIEVFCEQLNPKTHGVWWGIHATARQRAEAFLRTLGKWEEASK
jgi:hypothetical protein